METNKMSIMKTAEEVLNEILIDIEDRPAFFREQDVRDLIAQAQEEAYEKGCGEAMRMGEKKQETHGARETPSTPPTFDEICKKVGFVNLKVDDRSGMKPLKRMAIWYYMYNTGVKLVDIGRQSKRSHSTVWSGIKKFNAYLDYGDLESVKLRDKINSVMPPNGYVVDKKYNKLFFMMNTKYNIILTNEELREIVDVASNIK